MIGVLGFSYNNEREEVYTMISDAELQKLEAFRRLTEETSNGISRNRDKAKGKVRLRWGHRPSTNISAYKIDKVQSRSLKVTFVEPNPVQLTREELFRKI